MIGPPAAHKWLIDRINRRVVGRFAPLCQGRLLDIGCGQKPYESLLRPHVTTYIGLEHEDTLHGRDKVDVWGEVTNLPFDPMSFDTVVAFHLLEHSEEPQQALREMFRVLRPGGVLLVTTPFMWGLHDAPRDFFRYTPYGLRYLVREAGFELVAIEAFCGYWATAGLRLCYSLQRLARGPLAYVFAPILIAIQVVAFVLDRLDSLDTDAAGYATVAIRPAA